MLQATESVHLQSGLALWAQGTSRAAPEGVCELLEIEMSTCATEGGSCRCGQQWALEPRLSCKWGIRHEDSRAERESHHFRTACAGRGFPCAKARPRSPSACFRSPRTDTWCLERTTESFVNWLRGHAVHCIREGQTPAGISRKTSRDDDTAARAACAIKRPRIRKSLRDFPPARTGLSLRCEKANFLNWLR